MFHVSKQTAVDHRRAFSLVEVLVVIGIIALLIAMLMPALRAARDHARRVACASQLRQVGTALLMYANANHGWLPAWSGWHTYPAGGPEDQEGPAWTIELMPYIGSPDSAVYNCPGFPGKCRNYFLSAVWASRNRLSATQLSAIKMSSRFILSGDVTQPNVYPPPYGTAEHSTIDADLSDEAEPLLAFPQEGGFVMHRGGSNVLFDDMHVDSFREFEVNLMTYHPRRMMSWSDVHALDEGQ